MKKNDNAVLLKIYIGESDKYKHKPLYEEIINEARRLKLAGTTVTKGIMGFGADSHLHTSKILRLSEDLPIIIEIIDVDENIKKIMPFLDEAVNDGLIIKENVKIISYKSSKKQL